MIQNEILQEAFGKSRIFLNDSKPYALMFPGLYTRNAIKRNGGVVEPCRKLRHELLENEFRKSVEKLEYTENKLAWWALTGEWPGG